MIGGYRKKPNMLFMHRIVLIITENNVCRIVEHERHAKPSICTASLTINKKAKYFCDNSALNNMCFLKISTLINYMPRYIAASVTTLSFLI